MLDTILAPTARSFEWHPRWSKRQQVGAFKDGEGNFFFAWFSPRGAVVRGFDHESAISPFRTDPPRIWPGLFDGFPKALDYATKEPSFALDEITFCFWSTGRNAAWSGGSASDTRESDGAEAVLGCFGKDFPVWASSYYGLDLDRTALSRVWWGRPIDWETLEALNVDFDERAVREEAELLDWKIDLSRRERRTDSVSERPRPLRMTSDEVLETFDCPEFVVRCEPTRVVLRIHDHTIASSHENVYAELLDLVRERLEGR
jgi:hypothetical protein